MKCWEGEPCAPGAYLTVALSLILTLCLSLFFALFAGARKGLVREQAELVTDLAADSVLAEYNQALFDQYALLFVDCSYQTPDPSEEAVAAHLLSYMQKNLSPRDLSGLVPVRSFTALSAGKSELLSTRYATDQGGLPVREEIAAYMKADPAGSAAGEVTALLSSWEGLSVSLDFSGTEENSWEQDRQSNLDAIREVKEGLAEKGEDLQDAADGDPAEVVDQFRTEPILSQVLPEGAKVSDAALSLPELPSHRALHEGSGLVPENVRNDGEPDAVLFDLYLAEKCGFFGREKERSALSYELEYLLFGKRSDRDNLTETAKQLLYVRTVCNGIFLAGNAARKAAAREYALALAAVIAHPALTEVFTAAILLAWSYVESVRDVRILLAGGRVPLLKTDADWSTDVSDILRPGSVSGDAGKGHGLSYEDYLQIFLFFLPEAVKTDRFLDVCEADIRKTRGNENFRIDWCLDAFLVRASYTGGFGDRFAVEKEASYH
ncbi:MAG: DUF5702 domain-containing protein [Lachnospiraceae bacterium]